jgi:CRP/FNR family transcriptional regulator, cyclic AMP receptor protein
MVLADPWAGRCEGKVVGVSSQMWEQLRSAGVGRRFRRGEVILRQGDPPSHVLLLISGRVKVLLALPSDEILLAVRGPGELLGDVAVLGDEEEGRSATVIAIDPCVTSVLPAARFRALVHSAGLGDELLRSALRRLREGERWRAETAVLPAAPRVARALVRLAGRGAGEPVEPVEVVLGQAEIGQAVGLSRGVVAAELSRLREQGIVVTSRSRIVITDLPRLRVLAESEHGSV